MQAAPLVRGMGAPIVRPGVASPDEADFFAGPPLIFARQFCLPVRGPLCVGGKVGNVRRNRRQAGPEYRRRIQQGEVQVDRRQWRAARMTSATPLRLFEQPHERRVDLEHDPPALRGDQGRVTGELQDVAQTLFPMQQQGAAGQRLTFPARHGKGSLQLRGVAAFPTPTVVLPPRRVVPQQKLNVRHVIAGCRIGSVDL